MDDKREQLRTRVLKAATMSFANGGAVSCVIRNMSSQGAALDVESSVSIPDKFDLLVDRNEAQYQCELIWRKARRIGVRFRSAS